MTLRKFCPSDRRGKLSVQCLLIRNHEVQTSSQKTLTKVRVEPQSFAEGSERSAYKVTDENQREFVLKSIKSTQDAIVYVDNRNYASILAKVIKYVPPGGNNIND